MGRDNFWGFEEKKTQGHVVDLGLQYYECVGNAMMQSKQFK